MMRQNLIMQKLSGSHYLVIRLCNQSIADLIYWLEKHQSSGSRDIGSTLNLGGQVVNSDFKIDAIFCAQNWKSLLNFIAVTAMVYRSKLAVKENYNCKTLDGCILNIETFERWEKSLRSIQGHRIAEFLKSGSV